MAYVAIWQDQAEVRGAPNNFLGSGYLEDNILTVTEEAEGAAKVNWKTVKLRLTAPQGGPTVPAEKVAAIRTVLIYHTRASHS